MGTECCHIYSFCFGRNPNGFTGATGIVGFAGAIGFKGFNGANGGLGSNNGFVGSGFALFAVECALAVNLGLETVLAWVLLCKVIFALSERLDGPSDEGESPSSF